VASSRNAALSEVTDAAAYPPISERDKEVDDDDEKDVGPTEETVTPDLRKPGDAAPSRPRTLVRGQQSPDGTVTTAAPAAPAGNDVELANGDEKKEEGDERARATTPNKMVSFGDSFNDGSMDRDGDGETGAPADEGFSVGVSLRETLEMHLGPRKSWKEGYLRDVAARTFPLWGVVLVLILTRVDDIGIKPYLTKTEPYFQIVFGTYGDFRLSVSVVFQLRNILTYPNLNWSFAFFYLPFIMPFVLVSVATMILYRKDMKSTPWQITKTVGCRLVNPAIALMGALVLVQLMIKTETAAPSYILGTVLADWFRQGFVVISPLLGALGSFFSGSTTVSNLTFGSIQQVSFYPTTSKEGNAKSVHAFLLCRDIIIFASRQIAAERVNISVTSMLALQAVGASAGNGICLNNIIAAITVVGLTVREGAILVKTARFVFSLTTIATIVMLAFFIRFK